MCYAILLYIYCCTLYTLSIGMLSTVIHSTVRVCTKSYCTTTTGVNFSPYSRYFCTSNTVTVKLYVSMPKIACLWVSIYWKYPSFLWLKEKKKLEIERHCTIIRNFTTTMIKNVAFIHIYELLYEWHLSRSEYFTQLLLLLESQGKGGVRVVVRSEVPLCGRPAFILWQPGILYRVLLELELHWVTIFWRRR